MKQNGRRKVTPDMIERMKKLDEVGLSHKAIADNLKLSTATVRKYLKTEEKRCLSRFVSGLNKQNVLIIFAVAFLALAGTVMSIWSGTLAKIQNAYAEEATGNWFTYNQHYLDNHENIDARNRAENYHRDSISYKVSSLNYDFTSGVYQSSVQGAILSLMFFIAGLSVSECKKLTIINLVAWAFLIIALIYFGYASCLFNAKS
jgi:hypothetical protein